MVDIIIKHRHPIGKKEAKALNEGLSISHQMDFSFQFGKVESAEAASLQVYIEQGHIIAIKRKSFQICTMRGNWTFI